MSSQGNSRLSLFVKVWSWVSVIWENSSASDVILGAESFWWICFYWALECVGTPLKTPSSSSSSSSVCVLVISSDERERFICTGKSMMEVFSTTLDDGQTKWEATEHPLYHPLSTMCDVTQMFLIKVSTCMFCVGKSWQTLYIQESECKWDIWINRWSSVNLHIGLVYKDSLPSHAPYQPMNNW